MYETSSRLLSLLSLLQSRPQWSGAELAERLDVTTRTIRNDIERLRAMGYPVNAERGVHGSYRLGAGAALPPLLLEDDEAIAVVLGLRAASTSAVERVAESSTVALAKLEQVLPSRLRRQVATLSQVTTQVADDAGIPDADPTVDPEVLTAVAAAIRDVEWLRFDHDDEPRLVEPYRLVSWERRWYLLGRDPDADVWGVFRLDRMTLRMRTGRRFAPQPLPDEDVSAYVMRAVAYEGWAVHARITVLAPAEQVRERINAAVGIVEPIDDESCVLITGADSVATMAVYVGLLDMDIRVDEPPELVERMKVLSRRYGEAVG
ncbi:WYL domain-containing protein [Aeromicrobium sp. NPDC092404]|uniref:helix-turn-helix transcriptional regulator n=1 Tax=Aeromicrobium sp. NPDC092404 TaxID=3154976 RepID=UPI00342DE1F7